MIRHTTLLLALCFLLAPSAFAEPPGVTITGTDMLAELAGRRAALAEAIGEGTVLLFAEPSLDLRDYRPEPNFFYLTGVEASVAALVIRVERPHATEESKAAAALAARLSALANELRRAERKARSIARSGRAGAEELFREASAARREAMTAAQEARTLSRATLGPAEITETLYVPGKNPQKERWDGPTLSPGPQAVKATGIDEVRGIRELFADFGGSLGEGERLFMLARARVPENMKARLERLKKDRKLLPGEGLSRHLAGIRAIKSAEEIERLKRAAEMTCAGIRESMRSCRPGLTEFQLQAVLEYFCRRGGGKRQAFASIVGSGPNSVVLHYLRNERTIEDGDLVLMDVGGEYLGYAADVTRTFPANGRYTDRQAEIYDIVLEAQEAAIAAVKPGMTLREVDMVARTIIRDAGYGKAFLHSTSHYVGLDVHDPSPGRPLEAGMVITVEPGIYLASENLGVRIEDTILVTDEGPIVISRSAPKKREEIEALMRERGIGNLPVR